MSVSAKVTKVTVAALFVSALGCGGATNTANTAEPSSDGDGDDVGEAYQQDIPITPQKPAPPALNEAEQKQLAGLCAAIEPDLYDAGKQGIATFESEVLNGASGEAAEKKGLEAALAFMKDKSGTLGTEAHKVCLGLFDKQMKLRLFEHEPVEQLARDTVDSCVKRAVAAFGSEKLAFDMSGSGSAGATHGPFCPDDLPVPPSLKQLPYKSSKDDWDTPAWKCLEFGLRIQQEFQIEYLAPIGALEFHCVARFLPRQGGAPIEVLRGGKVNPEGELMVAEKFLKRRMKKK
jgi:ferredoxin